MIVSRRREISDQVEVRSTPISKQQESKTNCNILLEFFFCEMTSPELENSSEVLEF